VDALVVDEGGEFGAGPVGEGSFGDVVSLVWDSFVECCISCLDIILHDNAC